MLVSKYKLRNCCRD